MINHADKAGNKKTAAGQGAGIFCDLHKPLDNLTVLKAAAHCLYCYDAPCIRACPTSIDIPTFIHQIRTNNVTGAAYSILNENIMGGTCARVCPTEILCEQACVHTGAGNDPVKIGLLQRYATDHLMAATGPHPFTRAAESGRHIAVVGAGPAGLACAHRAAMLGHKVSVYEARSKPGGLNEYGLAAYKMVDNFAAREVDFLLNIGGIDIYYGQKLGASLTLDQLRTSHDAVFIGVGLCNTRDLGLDGENIAGVIDAIDFIEELRQCDHPSTVKFGQDVIIIGGGNTAIDAAVQVKKLGAQNVTLVYRRGAEQMSATGYELDLARNHGVIIRLWLKPVALQGKDAITAVTFERTMLKNGTLTGTGEHCDIVCDMLLKAIGQTLRGADVTGLTTRHGKLVISPDYHTGVAGIFAGGDCVHTGEDLTVQAVQDGKQAAIAIDKWLKTNRRL